jgi:hypothetical protein
MSHLGQMLDAMDMTQAYLSGQHRLILPPLQGGIAFLKHLQRLIH